LLCSDHRYYLVPFLSVLSNVLVIGDSILNRPVEHQGFFGSFSYHARDTVGLGHPLVLASGLHQLVDRQ
jgi:hypothetical protein